MSLHEESWSFIKDNIWHPFSDRHVAINDDDNYVITRAKDGVLEASAFFYTSPSNWILFGHVFVEQIKMFTSVTAEGRVPDEHVVITNFDLTQIDLDSLRLLPESIKYVKLSFSRSTKTGKLEEQNLTEAIAFREAKKAYRRPRDLDFSRSPEDEDMRAIRSGNGDQIGY